jgi:hypothetical protein
MKKQQIAWFVLGLVGAAPLFIWAQDWYQATGIPVQRSQLSSAEFRAEFAAIESDIADKLPTLTGNGGDLVGVNSAGTALEAAVAASSTAGQVLRVIGTNTYGWGQLNISNSAAIIGDLPDANLSANVPLLNATNTFSVAQTFSSNVNLASRLVVTPSAGRVAGLVASDSLGDAWLGLYEEAALSTLKGQIGYAATGDDSLYFINLEAAASPAFNFRANSAGGMIYSPDNGVTNIDFTPVNGSFTASFDTGCSTTPTITYDYQKVGNLVTVLAVSLSGLPCTGDSTSMTTTGTPLPAGIRPDHNQSTGLMHGYTNAGTAGNGTMQLLSTGNIVLSFCAVGAACTTGAWTASGSRDLAATGIPFNYMLGNP